MSRSLRFHVPGTPQGKGRPRATTRGGFATMYTPDKTRSYEASIAQHAAAALGSEPPLSGPLSMDLVLRYLPPASASKRRQHRMLLGLIRPTVKPDADNALKAVADACEGVLYADDKNIVSVSVSKIYAPMPGVDIVVSELEERAWS